MSLIQKYFFYRKSVKVDQTIMDIEILVTNSFKKKQYSSNKRNYITGLAFKTIEQHADIHSTSNVIK